MIKLTLLYHPPDDPAGFDRYYRETHLPLARRLPGVERLEVARVTAARDGGPAPYHVITELWFRDLDAMSASFASPEGEAVRDDVPNFAPRGSIGIVSEGWPL